MNRRNFAKLVGAAASKWVAGSHGQCEHLPPTREIPQKQSPTMHNPTHQRCSAPCLLADNLIPQPAQVTPLPGTNRSPANIRFSVRNLSESDAKEFSQVEKMLFRDWLGQQHGTPLDVEVRLTPRIGIPDIDNLPSPLARESYELRIGTKATITAREYTGGLRGVQTLKQMLENASQCDRMPHCLVLDWPNIANRGVHFDLAREMEYRPEFMHKVVDRLAYFKLNMLHLYLENKFVYPSRPEVAPPHVMTPDQGRTLCQYAKRLGITIVPQIPTLGHMENFLVGSLAQLRERPDDPSNLCPSNPLTRPFLAGLITDVAQAFRSPFIHLGYDEANSGNCERCRQRGSRAFVLADHLNWLDQEVRRHGARTMVYGDMFLAPDEFPQSDAANGGSIEEAHSFLEQVNRDVIITNWHYTAPFGGSTRYLIDEGFTVYIVSANYNYWSDSIPLAQGHWWIAETLDRGIEDGAVGAFNTNWEYYAEFFDNFWFFQALAAERQWSRSRHDFATYGSRFSSRFWAMETDCYSSLAGLAEASPVGRKWYFLNENILAMPRDAHGIPGGQMILDYIERGRNLMEQAEVLRHKALRNQDTLTLMDMPGQFIQYMGTRAYQIDALKRALVKGQKPLAVEALKQMQNAAREVATRLAVDYEIYGGAVVDRKRIEVQIDQLGLAISRIESLEASELRTLTLETLGATK